MPDGRNGGARWSFGEAPLAQTASLAVVLRSITELALSLEREDEAVGEVLASLRRAEGVLAALAPSDPAPRVGDGAPDDGRVYLDHSRDIGAYNPCFPTYGISVEGDRAWGTVEFPIAYEGPPGIVHGGFLAVFFDCVMQHHNSDAGVTGKTANLALRYRRPTPLLRTLDYSVQRRVEGDRVESTARISLEGKVLCEAEMSAVAGDRSRLPRVFPRGDRRGDPIR